MSRVQSRFDDLFRRLSSNRGTQALLFALVLLCLVVAPSGASAQTNFGSVQLGKSSSITSITLTVATPGQVSKVAVLTQGTAGLDFVEVSGGNCTSTTYSKGNSCTVEVTFTPKAPGLRMGAVQLLDKNGNALGTTYIWGAGEGPLAAFSPGTASVVNTGSYTLNQPQGTAVDAAGNLYIADFGNGRVVKVPAAGAPSVVNTGSAHVWGTFGVAVDGAGNLFVAANSIGQVVKVTAAGVGSALNLGSYTLANALGVAVDGAGNVYIADMGNSRIVEVTAAGVPSVVKTGSLTLDQPNGVGVDSAGNLYIADTRNYRIVEVTPAGTASIAVRGISSPSGVAVDGAGNSYISFTFGANVDVVTAKGAQSVLNTDSLSLSGPFGLAVDGAGNVWIADTDNNRVVKVAQSAAAPLSFAPTAPGGTSADSPQTVKLQNIGSANLDLTKLAAATTGATTSSFTLAPGTGCTTSAALTMAESCAIAVNFTPQADGPFSGAVTLTDNNLNAASATQAISLSGAGVGLDISPAGNTLPAAAVGIYYSQTFTASSGTAPYTFSTPWTLPAGLSLSKSGVLSGTPTVGGSDRIEVTATDSSKTPVTTSKVYSLEVNLVPTVTVSAVSIAYGTASATLTAKIAYPAGAVAPTGAVTLKVDSGTALTAKCTGASSPRTCTASYATSSLAVGSHTITAGIAADADYGPAKGTGTLTVTKATPKVTTWPTASAITYGQKLNSSKLTGGSASVSGAFAWTTPTTVPAKGTHAYSVTFTPAASTDYIAVIAQVNVTAN